MTGVVANPPTEGPPIASSIIGALGRMSTPTVLNGLRQLGVSPEAIESTNRSAIRCIAPSLGPVIGFVATMKIGTKNHPDPPREVVPSGKPKTVSANTRRFHEHILSQPAPRFVVVENVGHPEGPMCFSGEVQAHIWRALGCRAGMTNGAVRDLQEMEAAGIQTFAGGVDVGGGFKPWTIEVGGEVTVGGLTVKPGDLLHGDIHGVLKVPLDLAHQIPDAVREVEIYERRIMDVCDADGFNLEDLWRAFAGEQH